MKNRYLIGLFLALFLTGCGNSVTAEKTVYGAFENELLNNLRSDLVQNLNDINSNLSALKTSAKANKLILHNMEHKVTYHDSLDYHFANLYPYLVFAPNETTFKYLEQNGMHLISNDSIKASVSALYGVEYGIYKDYESIYFVEHYSNYVKPMFIAEFQSFKFYRQFKPLNYDRFISNQEYRRILTYTADAIETFIFMQTDLKERVENLLSAIDQELTKY